MASIKGRSWVLSDQARVKNDLVGVIAGRRGPIPGGFTLAMSPTFLKRRTSIGTGKAGIIHSAKTLVDDLSVSEIFLSSRKGFKSQIIDKHLLNVQTQQLMQEFGLSIAPQTLARNLSAVERCSVEIVKAIALGARIVVLQDFSSFLSDFEVEQLLHLAALLKNKELGF